MAFEEPEMMAIKLPVTDVTRLAFYRLTELENVVKAQRSALDTIRELAQATDAQGDVEAVAVLVAKLAVLEQGLR